MKSMADRFWAMVAKSDSCWEWQGYRYKKKNGTLAYGYIGRGKRGQGIVSAHRFSWELHNGAIPKGINVLHECDNPGCVNPEHLFLGSCQSNVTDMMNKGRNGKTGPKKGAGAKSTLTRDDVVAIVTSNSTQTVLAKKYGVGQNTISRIKRGVSCQNL